MRHHKSFYDKIVIPLVIISLLTFSILTFKYNPLLMSSSTQIGESRKKESFKPTVKLKKLTTDSTAKNFLEAFNNSPNKTSEAKIRISQHYKVEPKSKVSNFDGAAFYVVVDDKKFVKKDLESNDLWSFELETSHFLDSSLTIGEDRVFLFTDNLKLFVIDKNNGELIAIKTLVDQPIGQPILIADRLIFFFKLKNEKSFYFKAIDANTLKDDWTSKPIETEPFLEFSPFFKQNEILITLKDGHLILLKAQEGIKLWKKQAPEIPIKKAQILPPHIFTVSQENQLYAMDLLGTPDWDYKLKGKPTSDIVQLPHSRSIALQTNNKYLHFIDTKKGQGDWHFKLTVDTDVAPLFAYRLNGREIENFNLGWLGKGWVIGSHCTNDRVCLFAPDNGRILSSFSLRGIPVSAAYFSQTSKGIYFLINSVTKWVNKLNRYEEVPSNETAIAYALEKNTLEKTLEKISTKIEDDEKDE